MIDLDHLRKNPEIFKEEIKKRNMAINVDEDLRLDEKRRGLIFETDGLRQKKNEVSRLIPNISGNEKQKMIYEMKEINSKLKNLESELESIEKIFFEKISSYPNLSHPSVPIGKNENDNMVAYMVGKKRDFGFKPISHADLGARLDIIDEKRASKISGSRFVFLKNDRVRLQFALVQYVLNMLTEKGFIPVIPPVLVKEKAMYGTGFFPVEATQYYKTELDEMFLVGTAEVPLCAYHSDEVLESGTLPLKYMAYSTCFRREAGSYGKDLGGLFRVHQFDKIEMFIFSHPDSSWEIYEFLRDTLEDIVKGLKIHYRVMNMCTGDIGTPNAKKYDIEAWIPSQENYREIASCSHDTDFQARRLNIKFKDGAMKGFVHTLNSTACAMGRMIMAILENYQDADGNIEIPEKLIPYMGGISIIKNRNLP